MRHARAITLVSLLALLVTAPLAEARKPRPYVKSVSPLRVSVGDTMTIQGFYFTKGYAENMVVFMRGGRVSYVRSEHSTKTKLSVIVPKKVERLLREENGVRVATRFRIKVIARRMSRPGKGALAKPTIGPDVGGDCDNDGIANPEDTDDDADMLPDSIEKVARTNECVADSDGDRLLDGWEYMSALDLNTNARPYPGKKPYPNALFADAELDYDDDGLSNVYEYRAPDFEPWTPAFPATFRPDLMDPDSDGDGLVDGQDDQDHDDVSNIDELKRGTWPMNPCDPADSRTCPRWMDPDQAPIKPKWECITRSMFKPEPYAPIWAEKADLTVTPDGPGICRTFPWTEPFIPADADS